MAAEGRPRTADVPRNRSAGMHPVALSLRIGFLSVFLSLVLLSSGACASAPTGEATGEAPISWRIGASFQRAMMESVGETWTRMPLRSALMQLSRRRRVAVFLDRRIDPNQRIDFAVQDTSLRALFDQLAVRIDAEAVLVGPVVYMGPKGKTLQLSAIAQLRRQEAARLPLRLAGRFQRKRRWHWNSASVPIDLVNELAREARVDIRGLEAMPHDLWPRTDLPTLAWTDRLTFVLAGFGLTFAYQDGGKSIQLVSISDESSFMRRYSHTLSQAKLRDVVEEFSDSAIRATADALVLEGTAEDHARLKQILERTAARKPSIRKPAPRTVFTLNVEQQPIGTILQVISKRCGLELKVDSLSQAQLEHRISFNVNEVTLQELLKTVLTPAGLTHRRRRNTLTITSRAD